MTKFQKLFYDIKTTKDYNTVGEDIQYKVIIDHENKLIEIRFEESMSREDWTHNFMFFPWFVKLENKSVITTHGYSCAYTSAQNIPISDFEKAVSQFSDYTKRVTGWSFGSAMAKIFVRHWYYRHSENIIDEAYTYGDVKCWLNPFVSLLSKKWVKEMHEFVVSDDFVTWQVPFFWRTHKAKAKKNGFNLFQSEYNHTHYDEYDYSKYE